MLFPLWMHEHGNFVDVYMKSGKRLVNEYGGE